MKYVITIEAPNSTVNGHVMMQLTRSAFRTESTIRDDFLLEGVLVKTVEVIEEDK